MGILSRGDAGDFSNGGGNIFWKPSQTGLNKVFVLHSELNSIVVARKFGVFKPQAPFNASWVDVGDSDIGKVLGLKSSPKAFIWVAVLEDGQYVPKLWECSTTQLNAISTQVNEFAQELCGMMLVVKKENNRWNVTAATPPKTIALKPAVLEEMWGKVVEMKLDGNAANDDDFLKRIGYVEPGKQRAFLEERSKMTWAEICAAFGVEAKGTSSGMVDEL